MLQIRKEEKLHLPFSHTTVENLYVWFRLRGSVGRNLSIEKKLALSKIGDIPKWNRGNGVKGGGTPGY